MGKRGTARKAIACSAYFFLPIPPPPPSSHLSFFRPSTSPKGCYFYSPQSSSVIKSKMAATTNEHKLPKYSRLHCWLEKRRLVNYHVTITIINKVIRDTSE